MRAIWSGAISFGLVSIPISLYPATRREEFSFRLLRAGGLSPVNYKRVAEADGKEVPWDKIVKGYEYENGKFVIINDDDFSRVDILRFEGKDLQKLPLTERKTLLERALKNAPSLVRNSEPLDGDVELLLKEARRFGLEGLIGKRADSVYEAGKRTGAWIKLKLHHEQEMVIGGFTEPEGERSHFGSLIVGYYEKEALFCAGKVGTGFNEALLRSLAKQFESISSETCPFNNLPEKRAGRYGAGITLAEMKRCHWLKPKLVCQVKFSEWTRDRKLRQPVFLGLRDDKTPKEVVRETAE